jgi:hypothetical protein
MQFIPYLFLISVISVSRSGDGSLIRYYSLNNPITDTRYSGQLSESCTLIVDH